MGTQIMSQGIDLGHKDAYQEDKNTASQDHSMEGHV